MTSLIQRKRWMSGIMQVLVLKFNDLIRGLFRKESAKYSLDTLIQFTFAYIQAVIPFVLLLGIIDRPMAFIHSLPMTILTGYIYILSTALIVLFFEKRLKFSRNVIAGILLYPLFVISFIPLQTVSLFKKTVDWKETEHTGVRMYGEKSNKKNHHKKKQKHNHKVGVRKSYVFS